MSDLTQATWAARATAWRSGLAQAQPEPMRCRAWRSRLHGRHRLEVGLSWGGLAGPGLPLASFEPMARWSRVHLHALQPLADGDHPAHCWLECTAGVGDRPNETAALVLHLDLVIAMDPAVADLARRLGCPTWQLRHKPFRNLGRAAAAVAALAARLEAGAEAGAWTPPA